MLLLGRLGARVADRGDARARVVIRDNSVLVPT